MSAEPAFRAVADLIREHARRDPAHPALIDDRQQLSYGELDALMDRVAAALQRDGVSPGEAIVVCGLNAVPYAALYLGALRAGVVVAPLAPSSTPQALAAMVADARARVLFLDATAPAQHLPGPDRLPRVSLDGVAPGRAFADWLAPVGAQPAPVALVPEAPFNLIYSSGTTGTP